MNLKEVFALTLRIVRINHRSSSSTITHTKKVRIWAELGIDVTAAIKGATAEALGMPLHELLECEQWENVPMGVQAKFYTKAGEIIICEEMADNDDFIDFVATDN